MPKLYLLAALFIFVSSAGLFAQDPLRVGVVLPLTGPYALSGSCIQRAVELADQELDPENQVQFIVEDDQYQPKNAVAAVQKLLALDKVKALFVFGSASSEAIADIAERQRIPLISISTATTVTNKRNYVVRHWVNADDEAQALISEAKRRKIKDVAMVTTNSDGYLAVRDEFLARQPPQVIYDQIANPEEHDFRTYAAKIKVLNPGAVFLLLGPGQFNTLAKMLRQIGYRGEFFAIHSIEMDPEVVGLHPSFIGTWYVLGDERKAQAFRTKYKAKFGQDPVSGAANGYDIAKLVIQALKTSDPNRYLHEVKNFEGAFGTYGSNSKKGFNIPVAIKEITTTGLRYLN
jgi:branched-chain amino acid transport system substrate-binding protein